VVNREHSVERSERRLLRLMAIGNQTAQNIDKAVDRRPMARRLDLGDVLHVYGISRHCASSLAIALAGSDRTDRILFSDLPANWLRHL
jgi:hypothetical protein